MSVSWGKELDDAEWPEGIDPILAKGEEFEQRPVSFAWVTVAFVFCAAFWWGVIRLVIWALVVRR